MTNVKFKKLTIKNFMSIGDDPMEIDFNKGLIFITGFNKDSDSYNGVGKTTIINAFFYALFGTLYGDNSGNLKQADIVNNVVGGTPVVKLELESDGVDYVITRQAKPSKCLLTRAGNEANQNFSIAETNAEICNIIKGDSEVYTNIVIMDSDSKPFLLKENSKRIKFIENVFGLGIYSKMLKIASAEFTDKNKQLTILNTSLKEVERFLDKSKLDAKNFEENVKRNIDQIHSSISTIKSNIENLRKKAPIDNKDKIEKLKKDLEGHVDRLSKGEIAKVKSESKIRELELELRNLNSQIIDPSSLVCRACKRPLDSHNKEDIEKENKDTKEKIKNKESEINDSKNFHSKILSGISKLNNLKLSISNEIKELEKLQTEYESVDSDISAMEVSIKVHNESISKLENSENPFSENIKTYTEELKDKTKEVKELEAEVEILDYVKYLCSPEGIKAHIISKIVTLFNSKLNVYLKRLGAPFNIEFDQFFDSVIKNENGAEVSYFSLSGGERKRVGLACLFAFKDIRRLQSNISINVTMIDELLDSALCVSGMTNALEIFKESADKNDESIFIITHRGSQIDDFQSSEVINLVKENKITKRI